MAHETRETLETLKSYKKRHNPEGVNIVSDEEIEHYENSLKQYKKVFGEGFGKGEWDWASHALSNPKPNFQHIEENVELDYLRPVYKDASTNVHASSRGTIYRLGLPDTRGKILVGNSLYGVGEIARNTHFEILVFLEVLMVL